MSQTPKQGYETGPKWLWWIAIGLSLIVVIAVAIIVAWSTSELTSRTSSNRSSRPVVEEWVFNWKLLPDQPKQTGNVKSLTFPIKKLECTNRTIIWSIDTSNASGGWTGSKQGKYYKGTWSDNLGNTGTFYELEFITPDYAKGYSKDDRKGSIAEIILIKKLT